MPIYADLEVQLKGTSKKRSRRFLLAADVSFRELEAAIKEACGWTGGRGGFFRGSALGAANIDPDSPLLIIFDPPTTRRCVYVYDPDGAWWEHQVRLRAYKDLPQIFERRLVTAKRAFPDEAKGDLASFERALAEGSVEEELDVGSLKEGFEA